MYPTGSYEDIQFSNINIETTWLAETDKDRRNSFPLFVDVESRNAQTALGTICNMFPPSVFLLISTDAKLESILKMPQELSLLPEIYMIKSPLLEFVLLLCKIRISIWMAKIF